jgi:hypothetical protein
MNFISFEKEIPKEYEQDIIFIELKTKRIGFGKFTLNNDGVDENDLIEQGITYSKSGYLPCYSQIIDRNNDIDNFPIYNLEDYAWAVIDKMDITVDGIPLII